MKIPFFSKKKTVEENGNEYKGPKAVNIPLKEYWKSQVIQWFRTLRSPKSNDLITEELPSLPIAHADWYQQDNIDTEGDANSEYEVEQRIYENPDSLRSEKAASSIPAITYDMENALPAFEGAGTEPNTSKLVPTEIWSTFLPSPRP